MLNNTHSSIAIIRCQNTDNYDHLVLVSKQFVFLLWFTDPVVRSPRYCMSYAMYDLSLMQEVCVRTYLRTDHALSVAEAVTIPCHTWTTSFCQLLPE